MTRCLRLSPSSPERMAGLLVQLRDWCVHRGGYAVGTRNTVELWNRGARLMLRWYAHGVRLSGEWCCQKCYLDNWCERYFRQRFPLNGDERLRRELGE